MEQNKKYNNNINLWTFYFVHVHFLKFPVPSTIILNILIFPLNYQKNILNVYKIISAFTAKEYFNS